MPVIQVRGLCKGFRIPTVRRETIREHFLAFFLPRRTEELTVLENVAFDVARGEALGIMGRNGCGKSTLLKILAGIYTPDAGSVEVGAPMTPILELGVGWNPELDAVDNILLIGTVMGLTPAELRRVTPDIMAFAGLERFLHLELKHYSSGMAARLAFSVAFMAVRDVIVLDEIFAVGDAEFKARCWARLLRLKSEGHTILLVSHNSADITEFCDRALLLEGGRIAKEGPSGAVADAYEDLLGGG